MQYHVSNYRGGLLFCCVAALLLISVSGAFYHESALAWGVGFAYIIYDTALLFYIAWVTRRIDQVSTKNKVADNNADVADRTGLIDGGSLPTVAALVPIYNEQSAVIQTVDHLLAQSQKLKQIIIIDDGSTDSSIEILNQHYNFDASSRVGSMSPTLQQSRKYDHLWLLKKKNSGKASSLNLGFKQVKADITLTVDADTLLDVDSIAAVQTAFIEQKNLVAAGGVLKPLAKGRGFAQALSTFQFFEYVLSYLSRAAWGQTNALLLVSGALAAYRTDALRRVGGFDATSLVEDYELTHRLHDYSCVHNLDWQITTLPGAKGITDAPGTVEAFLQQRKRWFAGFLRTHYQYRRMIAQPRYRSVGLFMMPIKTIDTLQPLYGLFALIVLVLLLFSDHVVSSVIWWTITTKLIIDFSYHIWALRKYLRWIHEPQTLKLWLYMTTCVLVAPFVFQPLRHLAALLGWFMINNRSAKWRTIRSRVMDNS